MTKDTKSTESILGIVVGFCHPLLSFPRRLAPGSDDHCWATGLIFQNSSQLDSLGLDAPGRLYWLCEFSRIAGAHLLRHSDANCLPLQARE